MNLCSYLNSSENGGRSYVTITAGRPMSSPKICAGSLKIGKSKPELPGVLLKPPLNIELTASLVCCWFESSPPPSALSNAPGAVRSERPGINPSIFDLNADASPRLPKLKLGLLRSPEPVPPSSEEDELLLSMILR